MTTTNNTNNNRHVANIVEKIMMDDDEEDTSSISGLNDMHTATAGAGAAAALSKVDQGSKAPSSSGNTSSIWSRMKSSFYAGGGKNQQDEQESEKEKADRDTSTEAEAEANEPSHSQKKRKLLIEQSQSIVNKSEANLAEALRKTKEEEEKWQLTNRSIFEKDDVDADDSLVGGTIIVPDGGELSLAERGNESPGLSFRASMAEASMADIFLLEGGEEQTNDKKGTEEKVEAKEPSVPVLDDICLLGSTIDTLVRDDATKVDDLDLKIPAENDAAKVGGAADLEHKKKEDDSSVSDDKAQDESTPIACLGDSTAAGGDDGTFGQAFAGIGERMFLSDAVNNAPENAPETAPVATTGTPKTNDENAAAPAPTAGVGKNKYRMRLFAFVCLCLALSFAWVNLNVESDSAPVPMSTVDVVLPKAVEPVHGTTLTDEPSKANTSCVVDGVEYAFGTPYLSSDGYSNCLYGSECAVEDETTLSKDSMTNPAAAEEGSKPGDVEAASELLCSYGFAFFVALASLFWSSLFCLPIKPIFKKTTRKDAGGDATTPSHRVKRDDARMSISSPTPRPAMPRTPVTETPKRSRAWMKNHDEEDIFASTVKVEVRTRKGRFVEARRSARVLKFGSPMKTTKRE
eukprot:CAMPEP_0181029722 /NCGR_PEP_ID=MMETSP1070-20121207/5350_1 /TAXON_ID=265543 /ORGANISM="Minutocellus polymorphus, Strain NH13" /LENGTH=630 /DNA_ID=CAMNT_0023107051 /DNA_START=295 /DNA_END=2187 /DNA_ORIENTATION=-